MYFIPRVDGSGKPEPIDKFIDKLNTRMQSINHLPGKCRRTVLSDLELNYLYVFFNLQLKLRFSYFLSFC